MKTKILLTLLLLANAIGFSQTVGDVFTESGIEYEVTYVGAPNEVSTTDYTGANTIVTIPATITDTSSGFSYSVTAIGDNAFAGNSLISISIPSSIRAIGSGAFYNNALTTVTIPASVTSIGNAAFSVNTFSTNSITTFTLTNPVPVTFSSILFGSSYLANADVDLIVPTGTEQDYINTGWTGFKSINGTPTAFTVNDILYAVTDIATNEVSIIDYTGTNTAVVIPATFDDSGITYNVTAIVQNAFSQNSLTSVIIPSSVTEIGSGAFAYNSLTSVTIPEFVTSIGNNAFFSNPNLTAVISQSTNPALITNGVFVKSLIDLTIPTGTEQLYLDANWVGFKTINANAVTFTVDDILYGVTDVINNEVITLSYTGTNTAVVIPTTVNNLGVTYNVTAIEEWVFVSKSLTSVSIPNSVTTIGNGAFYDNLLTSVTIPVSVTSIGSEAFYDNSNLTEVISESTNPAILLGFTFTDNGLIDLTTPTGLEQMYLDANWVGFKTINTNDYNFTVSDILYTITDIANNKVSTVDYIGTNTAISIPATVNNMGVTYDVTSIGQASFVSNSLTSVTIPASVTSIGLVAFSGNSLTSVTIPASVTIIGASAFNGNLLTNVTIPASVTTIGGNAFYNNKTLRTVVSESTNPAILINGTFSYSFDYGINSNIDLTIPAGTTTAYTNADWTGFKSVTETTCIVNIPDTNFKNSLLNDHTIDTDSDGEISCAEATAFTGTINVELKSISDLTGIESFINITELRCSNNLLSSLDVSNNTSLELLDCVDNNLTSLDVSNNTSLEILKCSYNSLTSLDVSGNANLLQLEANNNSLEILNMANGNNTAITLFTSRNNSNLTCIQVDDVAYSNANFTNIDAGVSSFSTNCNYCYVTIPDANFKAALVSDASINTNGDNEITCTEAAAFTGIMNVQSQSVLDLTGVEYFINMTGLFCQNNAISTIDISNNTALLNLRVNGNLLTTLDVSNNINLTLIACQDNGLTSLDVSTNLALTTIECQNNALADLDASNQTSLLLLTCNDNALTSLNMANGNNSFITNNAWFNATNNPNLTCIQVDDVNHSIAYWANIDGQTSFSTNCSSLSVNDYQIAEVSIYPNPSTSILHIETKENIKQATVYSLLGTKVLQTTLKTIHTTNLKSGVYILKIESETGGVITRRFVKQ